MLSGSELLPEDRAKTVALENAFISRTALAFAIGTKGTHTDDTHCGICGSCLRRRVVALLPRQSAGHSEDEANDDQTKTGTHGLKYARSHRTIPARPQQAHDRLLRGQLHERSLARATAQKSPLCRSQTPRIVSQAIVMRGIITWNQSSVCASLVMPKCQQTTGGQSHCWLCGEMVQHLMSIATVNPASIIAGAKSGLMLILP